MVHGDRGDDRNSCVGNVGGIPASSQTDLDHSDVHRASAKAAKAMAVTTSKKVIWMPSMC